MTPAIHVTVAVYGACVTPECDRIATIHDSRLMTASCRQCRTVAVCMWCFGEDVARLAQSHKQLAPRVTISTHE